MEAMDRLFQIDLYRHVTAGNLSALTGPSSLGDDILIRALYSQTTENTYQALEQDPFAANLVQRYCDGINYYVSTHQTNLPLEYKIFGLDGLPLNYVPAPFTPIDVIHMILTMGLLLTYNPTDDVNNWQLISNMGWQNFSELMDLKNNNMQFNFSQMQMITPPQVPASWNAVSALSSQNSVPKVTFPLGEFQSPIYREVLQTLGNGLTGSNNWAVAPNRTQNGASYAL